MYSFHFHTADGILEARASGTWTAKTVESYRRDLAIEADAARKCAGKLRLLFNATGYAVQSQDAAQSAQQLERVVMPGDRVAVLLDSSLLKLQARRIFSGWDRIELFVSEDIARAWLLAGDETPGAGDAGKPSLSNTG